MCVVISGKPIDWHALYLWFIMIGCFHAEQSSYCNIFNQLDHRLAIDSKPIHPELAVAGRQ